MRARAAALVVLAALPSPALAECYADRMQLTAAVRAIVASYKCSVFKAAIFGDVRRRFLADTGIIDHSTGSCQSEITKVIEEGSKEMLAGETKFCAAVGAEVEANTQLRSALGKAGVY